jgi:hypothetical protein
VKPSPCTLLSAARNGAWQAYHFLWLANVVALHLAVPTLPYADTPYHHLITGEDPAQEVEPVKASRAHLPATQALPAAHNTSTPAAAAAAAQQAEETPLHTPEETPLRTPVAAAGAPSSDLTFHDVFLKTVVRVHNGGRRRVHIIRASKKVGDMHWTMLCCAVVYLGLGVMACAVLCWGGSSWLTPVNASRSQCLEITRSALQPGVWFVQCTRMSLTCFCFPALPPPPPSPRLLWTSWRVSTTWMWRPTGSAC